MPTPAGPLEFHLGLAGSVVPFLLLVSGVAWLALAGAPDERGFWPIALGSLTLGLLLARDRTRYCEVVIDGMSRPVVMLMVMAWLLSGVLSTLMGAAGFVEGLVWLSRQAALGGGAYVAGAFLVCAFVSTATGTSFGTLLICGPLLYPAGAAVSADPAVLLGAILGGATFGDSISPISDTTIASAGTQDADIGGVVRARLKYVLPAGIVALLAAALAGGSDASMATSAVDAAGGPRGLPMLAVPLVVVGLLLARRHLIEALLFGTVVAVAIGLSFGLFPPSALLDVEPGSYAARSLIIDGLGRGVGVSVFTLMLAGLVAAIEATPALERLVAFARDRSASARTAEAWIVGATSTAVLLTTHSVVAILTVGEFTREVGGRFGLTSYRRANLLDLTVCTYPFLLPYCLPTILAAGTTEAGPAFGFPRLGPAVAGLWNVYSWALVAMVVIAVATGFGRGEHAPEGPRR